MRLHALPIVLAATTLLSTVASTRTAAAADPPATASDPRSDEAKERFKKGTQFYKQGDYKLALIEFERAHELAPNYRVLFNIGQANAELNNYGKALRAFRSYLDAGGAEIPEDRRAAVEGYIGGLLDRVASVRITTNVPSAEVMIDDMPVAKDGRGEPLLVDAGQHVVRVHASGHEPQSRVIVLAGRDSSEVHIDLRPTKSPVVVAIREEKRSPVPVIVGWSATGLFAASGMLTAILSANSQATLRSLRESSTYVSRTDMENVESRARTYALVADISIGAAVVSGIVATYLTLRPDPKPAAPKTGIAATILPTGLAGTF
jgi:hypothetical protein